MRRKIWRHTMTEREQKLWDAEGMQGWRDAFLHCVEDDAREAGCKKFILFDINEQQVEKGEVRKLEPAQQPITP